MSWIHSHQEAAGSLPSAVVLIPISSCSVEYRRVCLTVQQRSCQQRISTDVT